MTGTFAGDAIVSAAVLALPVLIALLVFCGLELRRTARDTAVKDRTISDLCTAVSALVGQLTEQARPRVLRQVVDRSGLDGSALPPGLLAALDDPDSWVARDAFAGDLDAELIRLAPRQRDRRDGGDAA